jgi:hypothetical protein
MPLFTKENAAEYAAKSRLVAAESKRKSAEAIALAEALRNSVPPPVDESYRSQRLSRVRGQLAIVDREIELCAGKDSKRLKELTDAQARLAEQERQLAGRPLPGSMRPTKARRESASADPSPIAEDWRPMPATGLRQID